MAGVTGWGARRYEHRARMRAGLLVLGVAVAACTSSGSSSRSSPGSSRTTTTTTGGAPASRWSLADQVPSDAPLALTPLALEVLTSPQPVAGTDAKTHLDFEVLLTNMTKTPLVVQQVDLRDRDTNGQVVASYPPDTIAANMTLVGDATSPTTRLAPSQIGSFYVDVQLDAGRAVPETLVATVSVTAEGVPPAPIDDGRGVAANNQSDAAPPVTAVPATTIRVSVNPSPALVIGPPLGGDGWVAAEGCCRDATHHRRGLRATDGHLVNPERFAIDFVQAEANGDLFKGEDRNANYFGYKAPLVAVADALVVSVYNGQPTDNESGAPLPVPTLPDAGGNHVVLDLGHGVYAFYGHLTPGSPKVRVGDTVHRGEVIAELGSTGQSAVPHLHFQLMDNTNFALSEGVPFEIASFALAGQVTTTGVQLLPVTQTRINQLPLNLNIINFPTVARGAAAS